VQPAATQEVEIPKSAAGAKSRGRIWLAASATGIAVILAGWLTWSHFRTIRASPSVANGTEYGNGANGSESSGNSANPTRIARRTATGIRDGKYTISEEVLAKLPGSPIQFVVSPDAQHWACVWDNVATGRRAVTADGKLIGKYGGVRAVQYIAGGKLIYVAGPDPFGDEPYPPLAAHNDMTLVVDGTPGPGYGRVLAMDPQTVASLRPPSGTQQTLSFSDDGRHIAYTGARGKDWYVNVDGKESGPYGFVIEIRFSPDGKHVGWITGDLQGHRAIIVDGAPAIRVDGVPQYLRFSPDGTSWIYTLMSKAWMTRAYGSPSRLGAEKSTIVRHGANPATFPGADAPAEFTPDGKHVFSFSAETITLDQRLLFDPNPGASFNWSRVFFNPDSKELVCEGSAHVATFSTDGKLREMHPGSINGFHSPDHRRTVTLRGANDGMEIYNLGAGKQLTLNKAVILNVKFGPADKFLMVIGRGDVPRQTSRLPEAVVVEDKIGEPYDDIDFKTVSSDSTGEHVSYAAKSGGTWQAVIDSKALSPHYEQFASGSFWFDGPLAFQFIAVRNQQVLSVYVNREK
jgi:hypothetical protein